MSYTIQCYVVFTKAELQKTTTQTKQQEQRLNRTKQRNHNPHV